MNRSKIIVHTDIFLDFLFRKGSGESVLRRTMRSFFCYTTVFNAIELFSLVRTEEERRAVEGSMSAMKILGLNAKSAKKYGELISTGVKLPRMNLLIAGLALESRLPVLTARRKEFKSVKNLKIITPNDL